MKPIVKLLALTAILTLGAGAALAQDPLVQVIHNSPSADAAVVDIYLNAGDDPAIPDLAFGSATPVISLPAGSYTIGIAPGNSSGPGDIIASFGPYDLMDGSQTVIMAAGELGVDFGLFVNELVTSAPAGEVGLLAFHGSPDAPSPVDIGAEGAGVLIPSLAYLTFQGYLNVPEASYILSVAPADEAPLLFFEANLVGLGGGTAVVFAAGYVGMDPSFALCAALNDGTVLELPPVTVATEASTLSGVKALFQ